MNLVLLSAVNCHCRCYNEKHNHDEDYSTATTILYATGAAVSISGGFSLNTPRRANREMISTRTAPSSSTGTTCSYMTKKRMLMLNMLHCLAGNDNDHVCMSRKPSERLPGNCSIPKQFKPNKTKKMQARKHDPKPCYRPLIRGEASWYAM